MQASIHRPGFIRSFTRCLTFLVGFSLDNFLLTLERLPQKLLAILLMHLNDELVNKIVHVEAQVLNFARPATNPIFTLGTEESTNLMECTLNPSKLILDSISKKIGRLACNSVQTLG